jgi:hypothetical protein
MISGMSEMLGFEGDEKEGFDQWVAERKKQVKALFKKAFFLCPPEAQEILCKDKPALTLVLYYDQLEEELSKIVSTTNKQDTVIMAACKQIHVMLKILKNIAENGDDSERTVCMKLQHQKYPTLLKQVEKLPKIAKASSSSQIADELDGLSDYFKQVSARFKRHYGQLFQPSNGSSSQQKPVQKSPEPKN